MNEDHKQMGYGVLTGQEIWLHAVQTVSLCHFSVQYYDYVLQAAIQLDFKSFSPFT